MATCFIFTQYLQENGCLITRFNDKGEQDIEAKHYSFVEIAKLQEGYKTIIVYPCNWTSLLELELPWLAERKARAAIPYALEDQLTQPIEILHFAFDKQRYRNGRYEIVVLEKQKLIDLINTVLAEGIEFDIITLDWFALSVNESIFIEDTAIIDSKEFKGPLSPELAVVFQSVFNECTNYIFQDSKPGIELPNKQEIAEKSYLWLSKRLLENKPLNLCQGALQHGTSSLQILKGYRFLAGFAGLWLIIMLGVNAYKLHVVNTQLEDTNQKIALIYKQFFPDAKQIINPKFRISQLLGDTLGTARSNFWNLINKLAQGIKDSNVTIEQFRFQNKTLIITVVCADFATLEKLEDRLKQLQLNVAQTQAANRDQQVVATLELK